MTFDFPCLKTILVVFIYESVKDLGITGVLVVSIHCSGSTKTNKFVRPFGKYIKYFRARKQDSNHCGLPTS